MRNDYVTNHIFGERSQTKYRGIIGFDSDATLGRLPSFEIFSRLVKILLKFQ